MIKFEHTETFGWEAAIRGMRNPKNSWGKMDSLFDYDKWCMGNNDLDLMKRLRKAGTDHRKYLRMIQVSVDITAPLYWWKEFDTYKVGTVANSCSTMHKLTYKEFELDDFSHEHLGTNDVQDYKYYSILDVFEMDEASPLNDLEDNIKKLNKYRMNFIRLDKAIKSDNLKGDELKEYTEARKFWWWQMIQKLPSSYNQKRTVLMNYETLNNIYKSRRGHKLDEWRVGFIEWIESLPYAKELIIGEE